MQVLIDDKKDNRHIRYGLYTIFDYLGLDYKLLSQASEYTENDPILYYGEQLPLNFSEDSPIIHLKPFEDSNDNNILRGKHERCQNPILQMSFASTHSDIAFQPIRIEGKPFEFAGWIRGQILLVCIDFPRTVYHFLSLSHEDAQENDEFGRPIGKKSFLHSKRVVRQPFIEELIIQFWEIIYSFYSKIGIPLLRKELWPNGYRFCVPVSHDIDLVKKYTFRGSIKEILSIIKYFLKGSFPIAIDKMNHLVSSKFTKKEDPYWNFKKIIKLIEKYNFKSTFFFLVKRPHKIIGKNKIVGNYGEESKKINETIKDLSSARFEIGLHGGFGTHDKTEELSYEFEQLESVIGRQRIGIRQHYLCYEKNITPIAQKNSNIDYDSTIGYRDICGYRCGIGVPFSISKLHNDGHDDFLEIPLIIMDSAILIEKNGNERNCSEMVLKLIKKSKQLNSCTTLLWHNTSFSNLEFPWMFKLLNRIFQYVKENDGWLTSISGLCCWWRLRRKIRISKILNEKEFIFRIENAATKFKVNYQLFVPHKCDCHIRVMENNKPIHFQNKSNCKKIEKESGVFYSFSMVKNGEKI